MSKAYLVIEERVEWWGDECQNEKHALGIYATKSLADRRIDEWIKEIKNEHKWITIESVENASEYGDPPIGKCVSYYYYIDELDSGDSGRCYIIEAEVEEEH